MSIPLGNLGPFGDTEVIRVWVGRGNTYNITETWDIPTDWLDASHDDDVISLLCFLRNMWLIDVDWQIVGWNNALIKTRVTWEIV